MNILVKISLLLTAFLVLSPASASTAAMPLAKLDIANDKESIQRGFEVYYNNCRFCHQLKYIKYQYLPDIGFDKAKVDALRGSQLINASLQSTMSEAAANEVFGAIPPDLSLMAKARKQGPRYIYTLLTAYYEKSDGGYDNKLMPGIKMPDPFGYSVANENSKVAIEAEAKDVVAFLNWAADPHADERKSLGIYVITYLIILSFLLYVIMKRVWRRLPPPVSEQL